MWFFSAGVVIGCWQGPAWWLLALFFLLLLAPLLLMMVAPAAPLLGIQISRHPIWQFLLFKPLIFLSGLAWGVLAVHQGLSDWLPYALDNQAQLIQAKVGGLPRSSPLGSQGGTRWNLELYDLHLLTNEEQWPGRHHIQLSAWGYDGPFVAGDHIIARVRLRRPRGRVNQWGHDAERHALARGVTARGSLVELKSHKPDLGFNLDRNRDRLSARLREQLQAQLPEHTQAQALLPALITGDRRFIDDDLWGLLRTTGTAHLMAISGLHITLVAGLVWWVFRWLLVPVAGSGSMTAQQLAVLPALVAATGYAALAGFALPTTRALIMTTVAMVVLICRWRPSVFMSLGSALFLILLVQPLSALEAGFWLSFVAVGLLLFLVAGKGSGSSAGESKGPGLIRTQLLLSLGLGALASWFFMDWGLISPVANLLMVPVFSLVIVPLALVGAVLPGADLVLQLSAWLLSGSVWLLMVMDKINPMIPVPASLVVTLCLLAAMVLLSVSRLGLPRWPLLVVVLPWVAPERQSPLYGQFDLVVFDVGQGQATVIRTANRLLLYDLGPGWPGGSDSGTRVVAPWIRRMRLPVTQAWVSHGDIDHAGGLAGLSSLIPQGRLFSGEPQRIAGSKPCYRGQTYHFDGVDFEVLWPPEDLPLRQSNNFSCVVRVSSAAGSVLLTGDITKPVEYWLSHHANKPVTVLQVPHHGSHSSSSYMFLRTFQPAWAVVSAGHHNRFGQPSASIRRRYDDFSIPLLNTSEAGMIVFQFRDPDNPAVIRWRNARPRPWRVPAYPAN